MEAPEKIYFDESDVRGVLDTYSVKFPNDIFEYVRKDVFIEKSLKFLDGCIPDYIELKHANVDTFMDVDNERFIKDFTNHMKGE
jgi:hypothetical protein